MTYSMTINLPGNLTLPVSLLVQEISVNKWTDDNVSSEDAQSHLLSYAKSRVQSQLIAGEILMTQTDMSSDESRYILTSVSECHEMIARSVETEWYRGGTVQ